MAHALLPTSPRHCAIVRCKDRGRTFFLRSADRSRHLPQPSCPCLPRRRLRVRVRAGSDDDKVDIDELARLLSQKAAELNSSLDEPDIAPTIDPLLGTGGPRIFSQQAQSPKTEKQILATVGDGGLEPDDFEIVQFLGELQVQQDGPLASSLGAQLAALGFAARYNPRLPYQGPVPSLLKEYLPSAKSLACNELLVIHRLTDGLPENKWQVASSPISKDVPVVQLLGYFQSAPSPKAADALTGESGASQESLWLVFKWEPLMPLAAYISRGPLKPSSGPMAMFAGLRKKAEDAALQARWRMLRAVLRGALEALAFCHERGVVHGSVSPGSLLLTDLEDEDAGQLVVKLDNFGFGRIVRSAGGSSSRGSEQRADLQALALVMAELLLSALRAEAAPVLDSAAVRRQLFEVFEGDVERFRDYCAQEPGYAGAVAFMDDQDGAGWALLKALISGDQSAAQLAGSAALQL